jgi:hypothetical protein
MSDWNCDWNLQPRESEKAVTVVSGHLSGFVIVSFVKKDLIMSSEF